MYHFYSSYCRQLYLHYILTLEDTQKNYLSLEPWKSSGRVVLKQQYHFTSSFHRHISFSRPRSLNRAIKVKDTGHHERRAKADLVQCQLRGIVDHLL
jgi:hypothetical protein